MIVSAGLRARVSLGTGVSPGSRLGEPEVAESGPLGASLPWAVALLSCAIALLGVKSLSGLLGATKPCERCFQQVVI